MHRRLPFSLLVVMENLSWDTLMKHRVVKYSFGYSSVCVSRNYISSLAAVEDLSQRQLKWFKCSLGEPIRMEQAVYSQPQVVCDPNLTLTDLFTPGISRLISNNSPSHAVGFITNNGNHPSFLC